MTRENRPLKDTSSDFNHIFMWTEIKPEITAHPHPFRKHWSWGLVGGAGCSDSVFYEDFTRTPAKWNIRLFTFHPRTNSNKTPGEEKKPRTNVCDPLLEVHKVIHPIQYGIQHLPLIHWPHKTKRLRGFVFFCLFLAYFAGNIKYDVENTHYYSERTKVNTKIRFKSRSLNLCKHV